MKKHIVIGLGEVGAALKNILKADGLDIYKESDADGGPYEVMHVCIPWGKSFVSSVTNYQQIYKPSIVIVHSSVPIGTCDFHGWVHSPIRGVHPNLELGIRTFVKYFGGKQAFEAAEIFARLGVKVRIAARARDTEAAKLWDTTQYGVMILLEKEIHAFCKKNDLDFETVYASFNETYNSGYYQLGMPHVARPSLVHMDGKIGGHCVIPNAELLDSPSANRIISDNSQL